MNLTNDPDMNAQLNDLLNLKGFTERQFFSCTGGMICPHCKRKYPLTVAEGLGLDAGSKAVLICESCGGSFSVRIDEKTPLGKAWVTEASQP